MRKCFLIVLIFDSLTGINAQVKVGATPTGRHTKAINNVDDAKRQTKAQKEQAKKSKSQKKAIKKYESDYPKLRKRRLKELSNDSIDFQVWSKEDSLVVANEGVERSAPGIS